MYNMPHQLQVAADFGPTELLSVQSELSIPDKVTHSMPTDHGNYCSLVTP